MDWVIRIESDGVIRWLNTDGGVGKIDPRTTAFFDSPGAAWTALTAWVRMNEQEMIDHKYTAVGIANRWLDQMNGRPALDTE